MPGIPVAPAVAVEIQRQLNQEWSNAHSYMALTAWCEERNYKGFAAYFRKQAGEERGHAEKLMAHLLDRGVLPELTAIPAPKVRFDFLLDAAKHAQALERANTQRIHTVYEAALTAKDYPAQLLLHWFINEQVEEEAWTDELVERTEQANCSGGITELDRHIERHLTKSVIGSAE